MNINIIYVCCLSRMMRKYHVRFLEGKAPAMGLTYSTEGNIINPRVLRSADPLLDAEAIRLTTIMPKWKPGMQRGQAVNVKYTVPIMFRLQEPEKSPAVQNATVTPTK